jgi:short-subunit dehydrogenase
MTAAKKYALITGATSGIGHELAKVFAENGHNLIIVARDHEELESKRRELTAQYGTDVIPIARDLFLPEAAFELYDEVLNHGVIVDILVNDAGQGQYGKFLENDLSRQLDIIQLNISSLTALTYLFLKDMVERNEGRVLQLASIASELPGPLQAVYHATKAYVLSFTEALINELKGTNVTMTALQPGVTDTDFFRKADMLNSKAVQDKSKMADPADVARDGYKALMKGDDKYVSGFKNKVQLAMSNVMPETKVADNMRKMQEEVGKDDNDRTNKKK